jgi:hypothetical protein
MFREDIIPPGLISKAKFASRKSDDLEILFGRRRRRELMNHLHAKLFVLKMQAEYDLNLTNFTEEELLKIQNNEYERRSRIHERS